MEKARVWAAAVLAVMLVVSGGRCLATLVPSPLVAHATSADWLGHWAESEIAYAFRRGIVTGFPDGSFKPDRACSRSEFIVLLLRSLGEEEEATSMRRFPSSFADVPLAYWAHGYLELALAWGLASPDGEGRIFPEQPISRTEMAIIVWKALNRFGQLDAMGSVRMLPFVDRDEIRPEAVGAVAVLYAMGVVQGDGTGAFRPNAGLTRAEGLVVVTRMLAALGRRWDIAGEVVSVDHGGRTVVVSTETERVLLRYREEALVVYVNGRRSGLDAISPGSKVGIVLEGGVLPGVSYVAIIAR